MPHYGEMRPPEFEWSSGHSIRIQACPANQMSSQWQAGRA